MHMRLARFAQQAWVVRTARIAGWAVLFSTWGAVAYVSYTALTAPTLYEARPSPSSEVMAVVSVVSPTSVPMQTPVLAPGGIPIVRPSPVASVEPLTGVATATPPPSGPNHDHAGSTALPPTGPILGATTITVSPVSAGRFVPRTLAIWNAEPGESVSLFAWSSAAGRQPLRMASGGNVVADIEGRATLTLVPGTGLPALSRGQVLVTACTFDDRCGTATLVVSDDNAGIIGSSRAALH